MLKRLRRLSRILSHKDSRISDIFVFLKNKGYNGPTWDGVFESYSRALTGITHGRSDTFSSRYWLKATYLHTLNTSVKVQNQEPFRKKHEPLTDLISQLLSSQKNITVLDIGGAMGIAYLECHEAFKNTTGSLQYYILENKEVCDYGRKISEDNSSLFFISEMDQFDKDADIVYLGSTIQYIENIHTLAEKTSELKSRYILITNSAITENHDFWTHQKNVRGYIIPYHFISIRELENMMKSFGYKIITKTKHPNKNAMHNFSEAYRVNEFFDVLFEKE